MIASHTRRMAYPAPQDLVQQEPKLDYLFHPRSIAFIGIGTDRLDHLRDFYLTPILKFGFDGKIYLVNPKGGNIMGFKVYPDIKDIPGPVDYAIVGIPARLCPDLLRDCIVKGVKTVSFWTAGFSEIGETALEAEIIEIARRGGIRVLGPNCTGIYYCPKAKLSCFEDFPKESGTVGFFCQSGGNCIQLVNVASNRGARFSKVVGYGNACDLNESDFLDYFAQDTDTKIITGYIEGIKDGQRFIKTLAKAAQVKPVILVKAGHTEAGARGAASHTGSMAGSESAWDAIFKQLGVIRVYSLEELGDMIVTFLFMSRPQGRKAVIIGLGGGNSVLNADQCENNGLIAPSLPPEIRDKLREFTPDAGNILRNPIDSQVVWGNPEDFLNTVKIVSEWEGTDMVIRCAPTPDDLPAPAKRQTLYQMIIEAILHSRETCQKPMAAVIAPGRRSEFVEWTVSAQQQLAAAGYPVYPTVARAAKAISRFIDYHNNHQRETG